MNAGTSKRRRILWGSGSVAMAAAAAVLFFLGNGMQAQPAPGEVKTVEGKVRSLTTAPRGEVDGAVLEDGTVIHWPPHLEDRFSKLAARGERIRVAGRMETGPEGDTHLEVQSLTNLRTRASSDNDDAPPPRGRRGAAPDRPNDRELRLRQLENQIEQMRREIERLRRED